MGGMISGIGEMAMGVAEGVSEGDRLYKEYQGIAARDSHSASDALKRGAIETGKIRMSGTQLAAAQKQAYTAANVDPTSGTAANVQADTAAMAELDAQTAKNNAAAEAWGFNKHREGAWSEYGAKNAAKDRKMVGQILGGAGKFMSSGISTFG